MCSTQTNMARMLVYLLTILVSTNVASSYESAQYLQSAVRDLRKLKLRRADTAMVSALPEVVPQKVPVQTKVDRRIRHGDEVPPISLTKGELAALYEAAITKGETLKLDTGDNTYINAAVHELDTSENQESHNYDLPKKHLDSTETDASGYYYYYYPIKSFIDEMTSQPMASNIHEYSYQPPKHKEIHTTVRPQYQYHSHHHQHNITINKAMMEDKKPKTLEPLFMAISGFIGMAVMFVLSVLVLPKFGIKPKKVLGKKNEKIEDFARLAMDAIDNGDCSERFACELSKTARAFNLQDNRFVKLLKRIAPGTFGKHIDRVGKYNNKKLRCTAIPCKKKNNNKNQKNQKKNAQKKH